MSEMNEQGVSQNGDTPAWASVLEQIPSQFRDQVTPALQDWEKQHSSKMDELKQQYAAWEPFVNNKVDPKQAEQALGFVYAIEQNPKQAIEAIQQYYNLTPQEAAAVAQQAVQQQQQTGDNDLDPRIAAQIQEIKQQNELMAKILVKNQEQTSAREADQKVEQEFATVKQHMKKQYGLDAIDERAIAGYALGMNTDVKTAAEAWYQGIKQHAEAMQRPAPSLLGTGGGLPTERPNIKQMDENSFKNYAVDFVKAFNRSNT